MCLFHPYLNQTRANEAEAAPICIRIAYQAVDCKLRESAVGRSIGAVHIHQLICTAALNLLRAFQSNRERVTVCKGEEGRAYSVQGRRHDVHIALVKGQDRWWDTRAEEKHQKNPCHNHHDCPKAAEDASFRRRRVCSNSGQRALVMSTQREAFLFGLGTQLLGRLVVLLERLRAVPPYSPADCAEVIRKGGDGSLAGWLARWLLSYVAADNWFLFVSAS